MIKHLYRHALSLQEQLLGAALLHPADEWARHAPRVQLDAWATLFAWHRCDEPVTRINEEAESAMLTRPLSPDLPLATAPLLHDALACQLPERREWIVIARHVPAPARIVVHGEHAWSYAQPVITYCASSAQGTDNGIASGFINLIDQPTPADLRLSAGTLTDILTERTAPLSEASVMLDDYRLALALHALYSRLPA